MTFTHLACKTEDDLICQAKGGEIMLTQYGPFSRGVMEALKPELKLILRYGVGVDTIDLEAATDLGVQVCNVPDYGMNEVADQAMGLMLGLVRKICEMNDCTKHRTWNYTEAIPVHRIPGSTVGIVGFGRIGRTFAKRMMGFDCRRIACDPVYEVGSVHDLSLIHICEDEDEETKLYTKADVNARKAASVSGTGKDNEPVDQLSAEIARGLGGAGNITSVDCCATRLRCSVDEADLVNEKVLKTTGAVGVIKKGQGIQVIYGPNVTVIKANLEHFLEHAPKVKLDAGNDESLAGNSGDTKGPEGGSGDSAREKAGRSPSDIHVLCSPFNGKAASITEAADEAFSSKAMGDGYMVIPSDGEVVAPEDCEIVFVFPSKHAMGLRNADGMEYLLHVGVDTVKLDGKGFETFVTDGQKVKKGSRLMHFDLDFIRANAASEACMVVFTGLKEGQEIHLTRTGDVKGLDEIGWY